jgi:hypothetical protein
MDERANAEQVQVGISISEDGCRYDIRVLWQHGVLVSQMQRLPVRFVEKPRLKVLS